MYSNQKIEDLEEEIREIEIRMDEESRKSYFRLCKEFTKDPDTYATLNYSLSLGIHHLYLKRYDRFLQLFTGNTVGFLLLINGIRQIQNEYFTGGILSLSVGLLILLIFAITEMIDLFKSHQTVSGYNIHQKLKLIKKITQ